jgi:hypothetical protein
MNKSRVLVLTLIFLLGFSLCTELSQAEPSSNTGSKIEESENLKLKERLQNFEKKMSQKQDKILNKPVTQEQKIGMKYKTQIQDQIRSKGAEQSGLQSDESQFSSFLMMDRRIPTSDDPKTFFAHTSFVTNIDSIPMRGATRNVGWSGYYWAMRYGQISARYPKTDKNTIGIFDRNTGRFTRYFTYFESIGMYAQPSEFQRTSRSRNFLRNVADYYSAAEKYDLLIGDSKFTLTNNQKNAGQQYAAGGDLPTWFGLCHGWAIAAIYFPEPTQSVTVTTLNGKSITFLPDDIKALTTLFWANADFTSLFIGNRCPFYPNDTGFLTTPACRSLNAGSFLITIGNHVGLRGDNLTVDPVSDPEIWNQPIKDYEFRYFNPLTNDFYTSASGAKLPIETLRNSNDSYLRHISSVAAPNTAYIVGAFIKMTFTKMTQAYDLMHEDNKTTPTDFETKEYQAYIELDSSNNIIGGEWKYLEYPQFIWHYDATKPIKSVSDEYLPVFRGSALGLTSLTENATKASLKGQVIKSIVDYLAYTSAGYTIIYS